MLRAVGAQKDARSVGAVKPSSVHVAELQRFGAPVGGLEARAVACGYE